MELLNLPSCIIVDIMSSWVQVSDIARLDTACCNHVQRSHLLKALKAPELFVEETGCAASMWYTPHSWLKWRALRAVKTSTITFEDIATVPLDVIADFVASVGGTHVDTVVFKGSCSDRLQSVLCMMSITCKSIRHFCSVGCVDLKCIDVLLRRCSTSLESIAMHGSSLSLMNYKQMQLPNVKMLRVVGDCSSDVVYQLLKRCGQLEQVILQNQFEISDACIAALEARAANLTRLELEDVKGTTGAALARLGGGCRNLRKLFLTVPESTAEVVEVFVATATQLHTVGLGGDLTAEALRAVATHCGKRLRRTHIDFTQGHWPEEGYRVLTEHCTALESLCCYDYENDAQDSEEFLQLIAAQKGLLSIDFAGLTIADEVLDALATNCPHLKEIMLTEATGYTEDGLMRLIEGCPDLQWVHVSNEDTIINYMVRLLWARVKPEVKFVNGRELQSCWPYTAKEYFEVRASC
jgi:hypothetical protein